jgi:PTS system beta-glucosides-specific IIC component
MKNMKTEDAAKEIIDAVGGKNNINNAWHCMTRLRFNLKDHTLVDFDKVKSIDGVVGAQYQNEQMQVVIGTNVADYFEPIAKILDLDSTNAENAPKEKKGIVSLFMDTVSGVFGPIVPAIAGAGMIKGLMAGLVALKVISGTTMTYQVIDMLASGVFTFLPFFVAASAAKIFKTNEYLAVAIAATLQFPTMTQAAADGKITAFYLFNLIPVPVFNYAGTVIPIILAVLALSYIYRWVDKILPDVLRTVFTPTISLFVSGLVALTIIGPAGIYLGDWLADGVKWLFTISPILAGIIVGAIRPVAILTGLHHAMTPIALQNFANQGYDMLMPMMFMANMAITGATFAIYTKIKSKKEKSIVISSAISGLLGITEPALFGVLTKYKKAFVAATIGSSVASAFISFFGVRIYGYILSSIFSLPAYIGKYFVFAVLGIVIAIGLSFALTYLMVKPEEDESKTSNDKVKNTQLSAVTNGQYVQLEDVNDQTFASKALGDGYAMYSKDGVIFAPVTGTIKTIFPTKHAIGIETENGLEVLIHMGIDTVELNGAPFNILVNVGDTVKAGTQIAEMDLKALKAAGKDSVIMVILTNIDESQKLVLKPNKEEILSNTDGIGQLV